MSLQVLEQQRAAMDVNAIHHPSSFILSALSIRNLYPPIFCDFRSPVI